MINEYLSYSRKKHLYCPLRYYVYYIAGVRHISPPLLKGTLIHKYYEQTLYGNSELFNGSFYKKILDDLYCEVEVLKNSDDIVISTSIIDDNVLRKIAFEIKNIFSFELHKKLDSVKMAEIKNGNAVELYLEKDFKYDIYDIMEGKFQYFKFIPDILLLVKNNSNIKKIYVIDIKTGGKYKEYNEQVSIYSSLLSNILSNGIIPELINMFYYVTSNSLSFVSTNTFNYEEYFSDLNEFLNTIGISKLDDYKELAEGMYESDYIINTIDEYIPKSNRCKWCMVQDFCPEFTSVNNITETIEMIYDLKKNIKV